VNHEELDELEYEHRHTRDKHYADRLKAVYRLGRGWQVSQVAQALMIDRESVRNHYKRYRKGGLAALQSPGAGAGEAALNNEQR
jgi:transposase